MMPTHNIVTESTKKARIMSSRRVSGLGLISPLPSTMRPPRTSIHIARPVTTESAPGMIKAARQLIRSVRTPAVRPADATPMLPKMPLRPSTLPRLTAFRTNHAIPTG